MKAQLSWGLCFRVSCEAVIKASARVRVSSENLTRDGSAFKLMWLLEALSSWWAAGLGPSVPRWVSAWGCFSSLSVGVLWREDHDMRQLISSKPMRRVYREHLLARWKLEPCVVNSQMKSLLPYITGPTRTQDKWMVWAWTPVKVGGCHWGHLGICPPQMGSEVWSFDFIWAVLCFGL